jgi:hypothetical protein
MQDLGHWYLDVGSSLIESSTVLSLPKSFHIAGRTQGSEGNGNLDLLHRKCELTACCPRDCRAFFDRTEPEFF